MATLSTNANASGSPSRGSSRPELQPLQMSSGVGVSAIVLTARDAQSSEQKALRAGAAAFLQKPADNAELLAVIRASLPRPAPVVPLPS